MAFSSNKILNIATEDNNASNNLLGTSNAFFTDAFRKKIEILQADNSQQATQIVKEIEKLIPVSNSQNFLIDLMRELAGLRNANFGKVEGAVFGKAIKMLADKYHLSEVECKLSIDNQYVINMSSAKILPKVFPDYFESIIVNRMTK